MQNFYPKVFTRHLRCFSFFILFVFSGFISFSQTSWIGVTSTNWSIATNWTNGVPTATSNVIIGDTNFTGSFQPTLTATSYFNNLTVGGSVAATLTVAKSLTGSAGLTINANGTIKHTAGSITVKADWTNLGTYTPTVTTATVKFGATSSINGNPTAFQKLTINSGYTTTLNTNISVTTLLTVSGTLLPAENITPYVVSGAGALTVGSAGNLKVTAPTYEGNYTLSGTVTLTAGSSVEYSATTLNQTIKETLSYSTIRITGSGTVKTLGGNLPSLNSSSSTKGYIYVTSGTLDLSTYTANRGTTVVGGTFTVSNGAILKIGGTNGFPTGFNTITLGATSTVEYNGTNQTIISKTYGNLTMTSSSGDAIKTMAATAFTVAGNLTLATGLGTSVSFTEAAGVTITGSLNVGASTTFNASTFSNTIAGSIVNNGLIDGGTATITLSGAGSSLSGSGTYNLYGLTITGVNVTVAAATNLSLSGTLSTSGSGTFIPASGETITMNGTSKTISGTGSTLSNLTISGTITSSTSFTVNGNLSVSGSFSSTGTVILSGSSGTISGSGNITFGVLSVIGNITATSNFNLNTSLNVTGSLTSTGGTATFTGTSTLNGTVNLYNVTLNGTSLTLSTNAILGIANTYTLTAGVLNVTSTTPNTVNYNGTGTQNVVGGTYNNLIFSNGGTKTASGILTVNGDITTNTSTTFSAGSYTHNIYGNWINNGTFTPASSTINFTGSLNTTISGTNTFNILTVNKSSSSVSVNLLNDISVPVLNMTNGSMNTNNNIVTITTNRTGSGIILGTIQRTHSFTTGVAYAFEGADNTITFSAVSGVTSIKVKVTIGSVTDFPFGGSINRLYTITVPSGTYTATLRLHYEDAELNGNDESAMQTWNYTGSVWAPAGKSANSTTANYVEQTGLTNIAKLWTCSDDANLARWNGSVSNNWATAANWTSIQGSPSLPPTSNDIAEIGTAAFTYQPAINTSVNVKSIKFGSTQAASLSINTGGSLTVQGNISGTWTGNATHNINVNNQTLTVNGDIVMSDGTVNHAINLNIGTGTATISGSITQSGGANTIFTGAGILNIGQNYNYTNGTFTSGTGSVFYNGTAAQSVAGLTYNNLTISKSVGTASINSASVVTGNLAITSGQLDLNAAVTVTGNITVSSGAILNNNTTAISLGGNWINNGTYNSSGSSVTFNGSGTQTISATTFNNLIISKPSGTATFTGNISLNGNLTISSGILDEGTYTGNRSSVGGIFNMSAGTSLIVGGTNNFPANFSTNSLNSTSTVTYNGTSAQTIAGVTYGNLIFSNGGSNAKTLNTSATVNGNLNISSGATFNASSNTLDLYGNWINNGTFTPSTSTINFDGLSKTITGITTFYKSTVSGNYTAASNLNYTNIFTILSNGIFDGGGNLITMGGDFLNNGNFTNSGTTTFSGTVVQNIQFGNSSSNNFNIVNFNGSMSPVFNSSASPVFNTVNINNTIVITADIGWTILTAFNIASGASFIGGNVTHTFYGSFTNTGTVNSSGTLDFEPSLSQTIQLKGSNFSSTGSIIFGGSGLITTTGVPNTLTNVTIANSTGVSPSSNWTVGGNFTINSSSIFNAGTYTYVIAGDIASSGTLNGGTSIFTMSSSTGQLSGNSTTTFYDLTITGTIAAISDFNIAHNFTNNGSFDASVGTPFFIGSLAGIISGTAATQTLSQVTIAKDAGISVTLAKNISGVTDLEIISGILNMATFNITKNASGGELDISDNATLKIGGTNSLPVFTSYSLDTLSIVEYAGSAQTISALTSYGNLVISSTGNKTATAALNIINNLSITNGTFIPGSYVDTLGGNWTMTSGAFTNTGSTLYLNSTANQIISSTGSFNNFKVNKSAGSVTLSTDITIAGTLTFSLGSITTGSNKLIIPSGGTISGASASTGWVKGNLQKYYAASPAIFEIGGTNYYSPVSFTFTGLTAGSLIASATGSVEPNIGTSAIQTNRAISRYWTLSLPGSGPIAFTGSTTTFNWNIADNYSSINPYTEKIANYAGGSWTYPAILGTPTTTSIQTNAITSSSLGDFTVGETCNVASGFSYSGTPYCSNAGTATITLNTGSTSGTFISSPSGLSLNSSTGAVTLATSTVGTYTVTNTVTGTGGCTSVSSTSITIFAGPSATISYAGSPYCANGGTASVTFSGTTGGTYSSTTGISLNSSTGAVTLASSTPGSYTVTYSVAATGGCSSYSTTASITISAAPSATISYAGSPYCANSGTASVTFSGTTGGTYSSTTGLSLNSSTGAVTLASSTPGSYTVTYSVAATGGCSSYSTTASIIVSAVPSASISYAGSPYCANSGTASVIFSGTTGGTYSSTTGLSLNSSTGAVTLGSSTPGSYTVTYSVSAAGGCSSYSTTASITVSAAPSATISYAGSSYCANSGTASVTFSGTTGGTYSSTTGLSLNSSTGAVTLASSTPGSYTVTYSVAAAGGCSSYSTTASITVSAAPSATISYAGSPYCSDAGSASVTRSGTRGGTYSSTIGLEINSVNGSIDLAASTAGSYTVTYTIEAADPCGQFQTTTNVIIQTGGIWTGAISTDWNNGGNWLCGSVPSSTANIIIPGSVPNYPIISTGISAATNINIYSGASLIVNGGILQVAGTITNDGLLTSTNGTIEYNGTSPQSIDSGTFTGNTIANLIISNDVTLNAEDSITGTLSFGSNNKTFSTNGFLTLKSTATGTARLADITNGNINSGNTVTGDVKVERFINAHRAWRLLTAPIEVSSSQTINQAWQENQTSGNLLPGFGTQITGGSIASGFDQSPTNGASIKIYSTGQFINGTSTNIPITSYDGYFLFVRGDRSIDLNAGALATPNNTVLRSTGSLKMNDQTYTAMPSGYSLVSNPYASAIDVYNIAKSNSTNIQDNFYVWDPKLSGSQGFGAYVDISWNGVSYDITPSIAASDISQYIQSGTAFFTKTVDGVSPGTVVIKETDKTDLGNNVSRPANNLTEKFITNLYSVNANNSDKFIDGTMNAYGSEFANTVDNMDALKFDNATENLSIKRNGKSLVVERRKLIQGYDTIFLNIKQMKKLSYKFQFIPQNIDHPGFSAFMEDSYLKSSKPLNLSDTTMISFIVNSDSASYSPDRFRIVFKPLAALPVTFSSIKAFQKNKDISVEWAVQNNNTIQKFQVEKSLDGQHFFESYIIYPFNINDNFSIYNWLDKNVVANNNYYRIKSIGYNGEIQYSPIAKINISRNDEQQIVLKTNVVINNTLGFNMINMPEGNYGVRLTNTLGQILFYKNLYHPEGSSTESLQLKTTPAKGVYLLEFIKPDKKVITQKVFFSPL